MNTYPYIANAAIILTANYLGQDVSCLSIAEEIIKTKEMPEPILLGTLEKSAKEAIQKIVKANLDKKADKIAENLLTKGKFE